jgi:hypothetical protein
VNVVEIERAPEGPAQVVVPLHDNLDYLGLPRDFRREVEALLGPEADVPAEPGVSSVVLPAGSSTESRLEALRAMGTRISRLLTSLRRAANEGETLKPEGD